MEAGNLQIYWHESQPVYSLCFPPKKIYDEKIPKLFTAGGDNRVRIWNLNTVKSTTNDKCVKVDSIDFLTSLQQHEQAINVIRFNHKGDTLASAGDDGQILLWKLNTGDQKVSLPFGAEETDSNQDNKESWYVWKRLRFHSHASEIYDLTWSPCDNYILCACMDNFIRIFQLADNDDDENQDPKCIISMKEHNHYVQGVTWDPQNKYIVSQSTDRSINIYKLIFDNQSESSQLKDLKLQNKIVKFKSSYMFHNETLPSFFRRLTMSPCGNLLLIPTGITKQQQQQDNSKINKNEGDESINNTTAASDTDQSNNNNCVYIFTRSTLDQSINKPIMTLSNLKKPAIIISFNPNFYKIPSESQDKSQFIDLPYKLIFAIATSNEILIYDTLSTKPLAIIGNLHYTPMTDLSWSPDGKLLMMSSTDGFCSYISMDVSLFGETVDIKEIEHLTEQTKGETPPIGTKKVELKSKVEAITSTPKETTILTPPTRKVKRSDIVNILPVKKKVKQMKKEREESNLQDTPTPVVVLDDKSPAERLNPSNLKFSTPLTTPVKKKIKPSPVSSIKKSSSTAVQSSLPFFTQEVTERQKKLSDLHSSPTKDDSKSEEPK